MVFVPRAGLEPARIASLVFETSASTDSATWVGATKGAKIAGYSGFNGPSVLAHMMGATY